MGDRGLNASIWASRSNVNTTNFARAGDWTCPSCGFFNFQFRNECLRCSTSRAGTPRGELPARTSVAQNTMMPQVGSQNGFSNEYQSSMNMPTPQVMTASTQAPPHPRAGKGLKDSLWAPRNYSGRAKRADISQVWRRKPSQDYTTSNAQTDTNNLKQRPSSPPDLGLPYEVQHFILAMIQRILEEGCYDFAYRWIPGTLNDRNWSCAEAVELSTWRDFLPNALPLNAIVVVPRYSLQQGLKDAVRIRNAAVHRHLCDNFEIRRMAQQAQDLMTMFRDVTRQNKFHRLGAELSDWDRSSKTDMQAARGKLQHTLLEINERPMDDMDWTPNAVSLQEITLEVEQIQDTVDYGVEMEID